ncbi:unnamed protein product [Fraxinus pennsylvanica]|uniref:QWRF motif-containing protein 7 n=1 Tax=Fraxinus pennsylvanica TaxID=56036 RepID=A0AAD1ZT86_9LAMI|nr:unnamed protein product [Fraxinus pennsylvanica]
MRPASPSKLSMMTSTPLRGTDSPTRIRNGAGNVSSDNNVSSMLSMMSFVTDAWRGKLEESRIFDAHDLRLLYNRQLQWGFVNARAEKSLLVQKVMAEEPYLRNWDLIDVDHSNAVSGAIKALEASIIRLPVVGGARANVQNVEEAISSAVDVMQAMAPSICSLLTKVELMNFLVSELANLSARVHSSLDECKDTLSIRFLPLQYQERAGRKRVSYLFWIEKAQNGWPP